MTTCPPLIKMQEFVPIVINIFGSMSFCAGNMHYNPRLKKRRQVDVL